MTFADRLDACIKARSTSQAELARQAQVSASAISDWMRGVTSAENVKAEPLLRAAAFLDVHPMWLLTGKGDRAPESPTLLAAHEPAASYRVWPFERVPPERYFALPQHIRFGVQMMLDGVLLGISDQSNNTQST